ncbi:hypothetical protein FEM48_Zijuj04G0166800 [Ziziphus jujuba var. spinosa]|uniref:Disease resistance R13L4/SHOC-2-like LRR domain-containing protein n=1 Tax=Ziziphus jujuba var. spinosa TaxID=714518 RepID=A0A978VKZ8_ZIZJJ|nr:hypothetical protein FEM48_Zijuj04G0166800 [Ziziphus jujuba var. spinosa]
MQLFHGEQIVRSISKSSHRYYHPHKLVCSILSLILLGLTLSAIQFQNTLDSFLLSTTSMVIHVNDRSIEGNLFSGSMPPEIGKLTNLQKLVVASNAFTGELPVELAKLTNLVDMHMEGCSLEGPIPSSMSALTKLVDLILRKCSIHGEIPAYIAEMRNLKNLDLSYNELTGEIPESFSQLAKVDYIYLTGNKLTGTIPGWVLGRNKIVDLSYNNFTWESSSPAECPRGSV